MFETFGNLLTCDDLIDLEIVQAAHGPAISNHLAAADLYRKSFPGMIVDLGPAFDTEFYLSCNSDVQEAGINPLDHFLNFGQYEGRRPHADADRTRILTKRGKRIRRNLMPYLPGHLYFERSGHDALVDVDPAMHYFAYGVRMDLGLFPDFDAAYYAEANSEVSEISPLDHYVFFGHLEGRKANADDDWRIGISSKDKRIIDEIESHIDAELYLGQIDRILADRVDAAHHYYYFGEAAGLIPNEWFDPGYYGDCNRDVRENTENMLHHYIRYGADEGRWSNNTNGVLLRSVTEPSAPDRISASFVPDGQVIPGTVSVIIPVYDGHHETIECLKSAVAAASAHSFEVIAINDASPNPALVVELEALAGRLGFTYMSNPGNLGFVGTSNRGLRHAMDRGSKYVVLLNSDTRVYDHWIDAMVEAIESGPRIGTSTAFSNNATIFSYPHGNDAARYGLEVSQADIARFFASSTAAPVEAPTGMGFAMMIDSAALSEVGILDEEAFGRGYGEEVDLCRRLRRAGYINVCAPRAYITHFGSISFGMLQAASSASAQTVLDVRYPEYHAEVFDFITSDPFRLARMSVDAARMSACLAQGPFVLSLTHDLGGGIATFNRGFYDKARAAGHNVLELQIARNGKATFNLLSDQSMVLPNLEEIRIDHALALLEEMGGLGTLKTVFIQSLINLPIDMFDPMCKLLSGLSDAGSRIVYFCHDYQYGCPRANFVDNLTRYCGVGENAKCNICVKWSDYPAGSSIERWRAAFARIVALSDKAVFFDDSGREFFSAAFPNFPGTLAVLPHPEPQLGRMHRPARTVPVRTTIHMALVGAIGPHKGSRLLRSLAAEARNRDLDLVFHVVGYCDFDFSDVQNIRVHGRYHSPDEALARLDAIAPDLCIDLSIWPETFCYTLSIMLASGWRVTGFDIGAQGNRLNKAGYAPLDYDLVNSISGLLDALLDAAKVQSSPCASMDWGHDVAFGSYT